MKEDGEGGSSAFTFSFQLFSVCLLSSATISRIFSIPRFAAIIARINRRKLCWQIDYLFPDRFQLRIIEPDGSEPIPIPLFPGSANECFNGVRHFLSCSSSCKN